jgi:hypothetical protein
MSSLLFWRFPGFDGGTHVLDGNHEILQEEVIIVIPANKGLLRGCPQLLLSKPYTVKQPYLP